MKTKNNKKALGKSSTRDYFKFCILRKHPKYGQKMINEEDFEVEQDLVLAFCLAGLYLCFTD